MGSYDLRGVVYYIFFKFLLKEFEMERGSTESPLFGPLFYGTPIQNHTENGTVSIQTQKCDFQVSLPVENPFFSYNQNRYLIHGFIE